VKLLSQCGRDPSDYLSFASSNFDLFGGFHVSTVGMSREQPVDEVQVLLRTTNHPPVAYITSRPSIYIRAASLQTRAALPEQAALNFTSIFCIQALSDDRHSVDVNVRAWRSVGVRPTYRSDAIVMPDGIRSRYTLV
jgi:hypothetical protein